LFLVPTNVHLFGNIAGVEGTTVTLTCSFNDSYPPVDNVTYFDNGQPWVRQI